MDATRKSNNGSRIIITKASEGKKRRRERIIEAARPSWRMAITVGRCGHHHDNNNNNGGEGPTNPTPGYRTRVHIPPSPRTSSPPPKVGGGPREQAQRSSATAQRTPPGLWSGGPEFESENGSKHRSDPDPTPAPLPTPAGDTRPDPTRPDPTPMPTDRRDDPWSTRPWDDMNDEHDSPL
ncbi:hypothetical protein VTJ04DRAFT_3692 [Mycothermus thermophilus]|uniref:uncharacterized protein n=1 Tax=Humicola insolens TaxID=85995 RepID=UPI0037424986